MRATHKNFGHPGHLRVIDGQPHPAWSLGRGWYDDGVICVSPSSSDYARLNRRGLPKWPKLPGENPILDAAYERLKAGR